VGGDALITFANCPVAWARPREGPQQATLSIVVDVLMNEGQRGAGFG